MSDTDKVWSEEDSQMYRSIAKVAVPARREQIATMLTLLPFEREDSFRVAELGCGEGALTYAILDQFPNATALAPDGSSMMRDHASSCLKPFAARANVDAFDLRTSDWLSNVEAVDCVVSSLCIHHLPGEEKRRLFAEIYNRLSPCGALLIADLVEAQRVEARELFAATYERVAYEQSMSETDSDKLYEKFRDMKWNYYRYPDPGDKLSALFEQLLWLKDAGFATVDAFWLQAGHAIYGGYKSQEGGSGYDISFDAALHSAEIALRATE